jgi:molybdopterin/thiamine biosynthesis adenylyltransferase/rhodanese-related sulfurtransferase
MSIPPELVRYTPQIKLKEIGIEGQEKLKNASVLCIGAGGIGVTLLPYLAAAGVGTIGVIDDDLIDETNLHRQVLYQEKHLHQSKASIATMQLQALNSNIKVCAYEFRLVAENAEQLIAQYDLIADCSDNFYTRYLIHDTCFRLNKPYIYASAYQFEGHCSFFHGKDNPCLHCLFPAIPKAVSNCQNGGVLGTLPGLLGILQATEIIKWITEAGVSLRNRLLCIDFLTMEMKTIHLVKNKECQFCVHGRSIEDSAYGMCDVPSELHSFAVTPQAVSSFLDIYPDALLLDVRTKEEHESQNIGGILIPVDELATRINELDSMKPILIYCHSGQRSQRAFIILRQAGFRSVYHLVNGLSAGL